MEKTLVVLGSTGSIGIQALEVAALRGFKVTALTANSNVDILEEQVRRLLPQFVAVADVAAAADLTVRVADTSTKVLGGAEGVCFCAGLGADIVLNSIVGIAGLAPTLAAIEVGSTIALANKETLVAGGELVTRAAKEKGVSVLPVDSEHSAIFQSIQGCPGKDSIKRLILTASGGPFFGKTKEELKNITLEQALKHPNWSMGAKITIDSATMMNKGLELIEAVWLFDMPADNVDIVVHRQSVVHSLVEFCDNSVIAQLGVPDMRIPIQYALTYPERFESPVRQLNLAEFGTLTFEDPDYETFESINLCREAIKKGGLYPACVNAANEAANLLFRQGKIGFLDIAALSRQAYENTRAVTGFGFDDIMAADKAAREFVCSRI